VADESSLAPPASIVEQRLARMLFFSLYPDGGGFDSVESGLASLREERAVRSEFGQVIDVAFDLARRSTQSMSATAPELQDVPLSVHGSYQREEILAALDHASMSRRPSAMREGVAWCESVQADALLITVKKSERDFSPSTRYKDYALSPELFHWESQSTTSSSSRTGQRYRNHRELGTNILLFVRESNQNEIGTAPYVFLGPADYVSEEGERPIQIIWKLRQPMPTEVYLASRAVV
jgi:hypothetical protein